ncbi:MAG TPA: ABC transporter permease [Thermoanaerobaculia bacterium]
MKLPWLLPASRVRRDAELDEEIATHLRLAEAERIARGESPEQAAAAARRELGNLALIKEHTRESWGGLWLERLGQDLHYAIRMLRRSPGFAILAVFCLTAGIGANAAVSSWIEGILLRPYALVSGQDRMLVLVGRVRGDPDHDGLSWPDFADLRRSATLFESIVTDKITGTVLATGDHAERVSGQIVSANYFDAIGVPPFLGRGFEPQEESGRNAHPVVVIGYRMWRDRFGGDPAILGKTQRMNGVEHTIVGVAPEGFTGTFVGYPMQFWVPVSMQETFDLGGYKLEDRGARWIESFARLRPGVTRAQAQEEISAIAKRLEREYPETDRGREVELAPLWRNPFDGASRLSLTLRIAAVVALFVLLIACANVSNLLLVRALARRREMTIRLALGASRRRLVRQLLTEGLLISILAAAGGILVAYAGRGLLARVLPSRGVVLSLPASVDWRVLMLSAALCLATTLLFGLVPAASAGRIDLAASIRTETGGVVGGRGRTRLRSGLVLLQVSVTFVLLIGAGLLVRSLHALRSAAPGFSTDGVLLCTLDFSSAGYDGARARSFQNELLDRVRLAGGVQAAAYARIPPFSYTSYSASPITIDGYAAAPDEQPAPEYDEVSPGFFSTLGIPLLSGRDFALSDGDSSGPVAIVNEAMARRYWPRSDPLGGVFHLEGRTVRVVGVAKTTSYASLQEMPRPFYYVPLGQSLASIVALHVRTGMRPAAAVAMVKREVHALDPGLTPYRVVTMREQVDLKSDTQRMALTLIGVFGVLALVLATLGLYGVMSYSVSQSQRELGVRMALGAKASDLLRLVLRNGILITAGGLALGAAAALGSTRLLGNLLYGVGPRDPLVFAGALLVMAIAALLACLVPARRAARIDPVRALRG